MLKPLAAATAIATMIAAGPVLAGEAGDITRDTLYNGTWEEGSAKLVPLLGRFDPEASFGKGMIDFVSAFEGFYQDLYRYGLSAPETGPMGPALAMPLPPNPNPEPLDYAKVRAMLEKFVTRLDIAARSLEEGGHVGDYVVMLDPLKIRIDANGDGKREESESLERIFGIGASMATPIPGLPTTSTPAEEPPQPEKKGKADKAGKAAEPTPSTDTATLTAPADDITPTTIGFDRADAIWLAGYTQVFAAQADFFLALDFEDFVNVAFHRFFPKAGLPMQDYATGGTLVMDPNTDTAIADAIAAIHTINWPVIEPDRFHHVLERFQKITALSRQNWDAILAENDDNRELVPSPKQTALVPEGKVTDETVAAWRETLDVADKILAGDLLIPHWRFKRGFNLNAWFNGATRFDLVMLLDGYDALPYLADGPVASAESFAAANRVFGDQWLGYVFWFN
jgi:hypothetical protein